ncbi:hypothetical protein AB0H17_11635 [Streptomyces olivoreticuli]
MSEAAAATSSAAHSTSTTETGSFCSARCTCGWRGPARRARSLAREDALSHTATTPASSPSGV